MQIYQILNKVTNKSYVGKSVNYLKRFEAHKKLADKKVNRRLYDSINFHGIENFLLILLEDLGDCSQQIANDREKFWISELNCISPNGYNMTFGGDGGNTLYNWKLEDKENLWKKQGKTRIGQKRTFDQKKLMSEKASVREKTKTPEEKTILSKKISETRKEKNKKGEIVCKIPPLRFGKDNNNYKYVDTDEVLTYIKNGVTLTKIADILSISKSTLSEKIKVFFGKSYLELAKEYNAKRTIQTY